jgi:hypothetical protein
MNIKITGKITDIFPAEIFGNFEKRVAWVLEQDVQFPNHYPLEFQQGFANELDHFVPGDLVVCDVDVRGRKWDKGGKSGCMATLKCWKIQRVGTAPQPTRSTRQQTGGIPHQDNAHQQNTPPPIQGKDDDLPF